MNYMEKVAHMLGVEVGEYFDIKPSDGQDDHGLHERGPFCIDENGLYAKDNRACDDVLRMILADWYKIIKLPFKPKYAEEYWYYWDTPVYDIWLNRQSDLYNWKLGNCFRTKEETETKGKEIMKQIKKEYEE